MPKARRPEAKGRVGILRVKQRRSCEDAFKALMEGLREICLWKLGSWAGIAAEFLLI